MILDANAFIGKWPYWRVERSTPDQVAAELRGIGVSQAAVCSTRSVFVNWQDGNEEVLRATAESGSMLVPFACLGTQELSHEYVDRPYGLAAYRERGFRGVRLYPQHHSYHVLYQQFVDAILEDAAACNWPVVLPLRIIMNWGVPSLDPAVVSALVLRHPKVRWILAGVNYLHELQMATHLMRAHQTVHLESSCIMGYAAIEKTVRQCGPQQLVFGSGAPLQHAAASLSKIVHAKLSDSEREDVLGGNLKRMLEGVKL